MPRYDIIKKLCINTAIVFSFLALAGHMGINFWERIALQKDLTSLKYSLYSMKETVSQIGDTYDDLHEEMSQLFRMVDESQSDEQEKCIAHCVKLLTPLIKKGYPDEAIVNPVIIDEIMGPYDAVDKYDHLKKDRGDMPVSEPATGDKISEKIDTEDEKKDLKKSS